MSAVITPSAKAEKSLILAPKPTNTNEIKNDKNILILIFKGCFPIDLITASQVCKRWNNVIAHERVWLYRISFPEKFKRVKDKPAFQHVNKFTSGGQLKECYLTKSEFDATASIIKQTPGVMPEVAYVSITSIKQSIQPARDKLKTSTQKADKMREVLAKTAARISTMDILKKIVPLLSTIIPIASPTVRLVRAAGVVWSIVTAASSFLAQKNLVDKKLEHESDMNRYHERVVNHQNLIRKCFFDPAMEEKK